MANLVSKNVKLIIIFLVGLLIGGVYFLYQKFFGGEIKPLSRGEFIIGQSENEVSLVPQKVEEKVAVSRAESPALGVKEVIARTGDLDFIKPGDKVLVKPNVNSDDPAPGTTHPEVVAQVVTLAKNKGAYVIVGDRSNPRWKTIPAMKKTGIYNAVKLAGADEIIGFEDGQWIRVKPEKATSWPKGFRIPKILTEVDHIINVPVLHTHSITSHSLALKNLVGLIQVEDRFLFHASPKRDEMIAEISLAIKPSLTVIDGTKAFIDRGPSVGTLVHPKAYLAAKDTLIADVVGVELLKQEGGKLFWDNPWDSRQIKRAMELNLSTFNKEEIKKEISSALSS